MMKILMHNHLCFATEMFKDKFSWLWVYLECCLAP